jgi:hypothetical protein
VCLSGTSKNRNGQGFRASEEERRFFVERRTASQGQDKRSRENTPIG